MIVVLNRRPTKDVLISRYKIVELTQFPVVRVTKFITHGDTLIVGHARVVFIVNLITIVCQFHNITAVHKDSDIFQENGIVIKGRRSWRLRGIPIAIHIGWHNQGLISVLQSIVNHTS